MNRKSDGNVKYLCVRACGKMTQNVHPVFSSSLLQSQKMIKIKTALNKLGENSDRKVSLEEQQTWYWGEMVHIKTMCVFCVLSYS